MELFCRGTAKQPTGTPSNGGNQDITSSIPASPKHKPLVPSPSGGADSLGGYDDDILKNTYGATSSLTKEVELFYQKDVDLDKSELDYYDRPNSTIKKEQKKGDEIV